MQTELTLTQKLQALANKYYQCSIWEPKAGDYYTSSRADLELYQVIKIEDGLVHTVYCNNMEHGMVSKWKEDEFTTKGFGLMRVHVPKWVLGLK